MKVHWRKQKIYLFLVFILSSSLFIVHISFAQQKKVMTRKKALLVAETTNETKMLYALKEGRFINCIEKSVIRPCDTDWVTCVKNAWVVEFVFGEICGIDHDGRMSLRFLIDEISSNIVSRFPEVQYFEDAKYCLEDFDCVEVEQGDDMNCQNFIYGQLEENFNVVTEKCLCSSNKCHIKKE
jgi:hypothetical protein